MRSFFLAMLVAAAVCTEASANSSKSGKYISGFYGIATSSSELAVLDGAKGSVMGAAIGLRAGDILGLELSARKSSFDKKSVTSARAGVGNVTQSTQLETIVFGLGTRLFILNLFNVHAGFGYTSAEPNSTATVDNPAYSASVAGEKKATGLGLYYGAGAQLPLMGLFDIFADYTINAFAGNASATEITGGVRVNF